MILAERYQVIQPLAQGGFGQTFLACDRYLPGNPPCVIKQFRPVNLSDRNLATAQRLFDLEAKTLYQLGTHPQIPTLLAHLEKDGEFYLVQEYIEGESLADELVSPFFDSRSAGASSAGASAENKVNKDANQSQTKWQGSSVSKSRHDYTYQLLHSLLTVLAFVHEHQVIHRDIKPANLIRRQGTQQLALIDFGAVKALSADPANLTVAIGSPGYIAPEQQAGRPCLASDLYAVGVIALYGLTGLPPHRLPADPETGQLYLSERALNAAELTPDAPLVQFIQQLILPDPSDSPTHRHCRSYKPHRTSDCI